MDKELIAINTCVSQLTDLSEESRVRVLQYIFSKFGYSKSSSTVEEDFKDGNTYQLPEESRLDNTISSTPVRPSIKSLITKDVCNSETEWILVFAMDLYAPNEEYFKKDDIREQYNNHRNKSTSKKNLTQNFDSAIRKGWLDYSDDTHLFVTPAGIEAYSEIINRK